MIYQVQVLKSGTVFFSHELLLQVGYSFSDQFSSAMDTFRMNYPDVNLMDEDVEVKLGRAS
ncbi:hypothetical protein PMI41_01883 [Phyllobacterium sp. YR531]|nr:hypothetical protein PMI41_01883 [Phyllobacterium sp. YR531]